MTNRRIRVTLTLDPTLLQKIDAKTMQESRARSNQIETDLTRYEEILKAERESLKSVLTANEMHAFLNSGIYHPQAIPTLPKIQALSLAGRTALADAAERWYRRIKNGETLDVEKDFLA